MSTTLVRAFRTLMVCAAVLSSVPSFEGLVLCYCGDSRVEIEAGLSRCSGLPEVSTPASDTGAPNLADSHCGECVDVPLLSPGSGIGRTRATSLELLGAMPSLLPARIPSHVLAFVAAPHAAPRLLPALSSSPAASPLRC